MCEWCAATLRNATNDKEGRNHRLYLFCVFIIRILDRRIQYCTVGCVEDILSKYYNIQIPFFPCRDYNKCTTQFIHGLLNSRIITHELSRYNYNRQYRLPPSLLASYLYVVNVVTNEQCNPPHNSTGRWSRERGRVSLIVPILLGLLVEWITRRNS